MNEPSPGEELKPPPEPDRQKAYLGFALRIGVGLTAILLLAWHYNPDPILVAIARERIGFFAAAIGVYVAGQALSALRWQWLARMNALPGPYSQYLRYYFVGVFTNLFVPGLIGGDAARSAYLGRRYQRFPAAIASVIADRGIGLLTLFWFAALAAAAFRTIALPDAIRKIVLIAGAGTFTSWLLAPIVTRWTRLLPSRIRNFVEPLLPYAEHPGAVLPAIGLSLVLQASLAFCQYLIARGLGLGAPLSAFLLCVPIANVIASLPLTLNGLGLRETAYLVLLGGLGISHADAIAMGLLWFAATMTGGLTGVLAFTTTDLPPVRS